MLLPWSRSPEEVWPKNLFDMDYHPVLRRAARLFGTRETWKQKKKKGSGKKEGQMEMTLATDGTVGWLVVSESVSQSVSQSISKVRE